jgi:hypothetical protein
MIVDFSCSGGSAQQSHYETLLQLLAIYQAWLSGSNLEHDLWSHFLQKFRNIEKNILNFGSL